MEDDNNNQIDNTMFEDNKVTDVSNLIKSNKKSHNPTGWPGAFGIYSKSLAAMKVNGWYILGLIILSGVFSSIFTGLFHDSEGNANFVATVLSMITSSIIGLMVAYLTLAGAAKTKIDVSDAYEGIKKLIVPGIILSLLTSLICFASIIALLIPFFFIMPRIVLAIYVMIDQKKDAVESLKESWRLTDGEYSKVYGVIGVCLLLALSCVLIISIPFALYFMFMYSAAYALLYLHLRDTK